VRRNGWLSVDCRIFDPILSMLEPDTLCSQQYFERWRGAGHLLPERRLMLAVLQEAVDGFQENVFRRGRKQEELFKDAEDWFFDDNHEWPFSFINICEGCGFNPVYFRGGLVRWKGQAISKRSKQAVIPIQSQMRRKLSRSRKLSGSYVKSG
jgi:hypothetical protein